MRFAGLARPHMRLLILSDLHVEAADFVAPEFDADLVVLAGDIHNGARAIGWARETFPRHPIVQIAGNHEYYGGEIAQVDAQLRVAAARAGVNLLENESIEIDGVRFLGCTLWTDFRIFEAPGRALSLPLAQAMNANRRLLADFFAIRVDDGVAPRAFAPEDAARLHARSRRWLEQALANPFAGPTVVVTHHLPSWRSVHPEFEAWVTNAGFVSDLDTLVAQADLWIHGHTHASRRYRVGDARVVCNPRGYPRAVSGAGRDDRDPVAAGFPKYENPEFDAALVIDIGTR